MKSLYRFGGARAPLSCTLFFCITPPPPLPQKTVLRVRWIVHT
jgi:hypothetical protein